MCGVALFDRNWLVDKGNAQIGIVDTERPLLTCYHAMVPAIDGFNINRVNAISQLGSIKTIERTAMFTACKLTFSHLDWFAIEQNLAGTQGADRVGVNFDGCFAFESGSSVSTADADGWWYLISVITPDGVGR